MKKSIKIFAAAALILYTLIQTACTFRIVNNFDVKDTEYFVLMLSNNCKSDIYGYRIEYYLDGKPTGGQSVTHADESKLSKNQDMKVTFYENNFPDEADISAFQIEISVMDKDFNESEPTNIVEISAEYGKKYEISVSGSFKDGFTAEL